MSHLVSCSARSTTVAWATVAWATVAWATVAWATVAWATVAWRRGLSVLFCALFLIGSAVADDSADNEEGIFYRREFVPAERVQHYLSGKGPYREIDAEEFARLVENAGESASSVPPTAITRISQADYQAEFDAARMLLHGRASLRIEHDGPADSFYAWGDCSLAISRAIWSGDVEQGARIGVGPDGRQILLVSQSGQVDLEWSAVGHKTESGATRFEFRMPRAIQTSLTLDLPSSLVPRVSAGLVLPGKRVASGLHRWRLYSNGRSGMELWIAKSVDRTTKSAGSYRRAVEFEVTSRGIVGRTSLSLQSKGQLPLSLVAAIPATARVVAARLGKKEITWSTRQGGENGDHLIAFQLPRGESGARHVLSVETATEIVEGRVQRLPQVRPVDLLWTQGRMSLQVWRPLSVRRLDLTDAVQSGFEVLSHLAGGEEFVLEEQSANAAVSLHVKGRAIEPQVTSLLRVEMSERAMIGQMVARFSAEEGSLFTISGEVAGPWEIESIESNRLEDDLRWELQRDEEGRQRILIQLTQSVSPQRPLRLTVAGRSRRSPLGQTIKIDDLRMVRFSPATRQQNAMFVGAMDPLELDLSGADELTQVAPTDLSVSLGSDASVLAGGLLFWDDEGAQTLQVMLHRQTPRFATENRVSLRLDEGRLNEDYRIVCTPESTAIERLQVHLSQRRDGPLAWTVDGDGQRVVARKWSAEETAAAGLGNEGETWALEFERSMSDRFEIQASRSTPSEGPVPVGLIFVPLASDQLGDVTIHAGPGVAVSMENSDLIPIPAKTVAVGESSTIRAAYRYEPIRHAQFGGESHLVVQAAKARMAFAWRARLVSRYEVDGHSSHEAVFHLENAGQSRLLVTLPEDCELRAVYVDDVPQVANAAAAISVDLPTSQRFPVVRIRYDARTNELGRWHRIRPPSPAVDVDVLAWDTTVLTPPEFQVALAEGASAPVSQVMSIRQRLLGPLVGFSPVHRERGQPSVNASGDTIWGSADASMLTASQGWNVYRGTSPLPGQVGFLLINGGLLSTLAWTVFLVVASVLFTWPPRRLRTWLAILLILGLMALLLPPIAAGVAAGAFFGAAVASFVRALRVRGSAEAARGPARESVVVAPVLEGSTVLRSNLGVLIGTGIIAAVVVDACCAAPLNTVDSPHRLVVPVDSDRQPVGDTVFVPERLYQELDERGRARLSPSQPWLLSEAVYRMAFDPSAADHRDQLADLTAEIELEAFVDGAKIAMPLTRSSVELRGNATLDGRIADVEWADDGKRLVVAVPRRGRFRLVIPLRAAIGGNGDEMDFVMPIPELTASRLIVVARVGRAKLWVNDQPKEISKAVGKVDLGPVAELRLSWTRQSRSGLRVRVDEMVWTKVDTSEVVAEVRWRSLGDAFLPENLRIEVDRDYRVVADGRDSFSIRQVEGNRQRGTYLIERSTRALPMRELRLLLVANRESGIGRLTLPQVSVVNAEVNRRLLGLTVVPSLQYAFDERDSLTVVRDENLPGIWSIEGAYPDLVLRVEGEEPGRDIVVRSRDSETIYESDLLLGFERGRARVQFEAEIDTTFGSVFQHQLRLPQGFEPTAVSVTVEGKDVLHRWAQTEQGMLTLFFARALRGRQQLRVRGNIEISEDELELPRVDLVGATTSGRRLAVFRRDDVVVDLARVRDVQEIDGPARSLLSFVDPDDLAFGRQVGVYELGTQSGGLCRVDPNRPVVRGQQATRLSQSEGDWRIDVKLEMQVESGTAGALRIDLPPSVADPITITPSAMYRVVKLPNTQVRQLIVYPHEAVTDSFSLEIRAPLEFAAGDRVRVPDVRVAGDIEVDREIIMPRLVDGQRIYWEVEEVKPLERTPEEHRVRVLSDSFSAAVAAVAPRRGNPQIRLAGFYTTLTGQEQFRGVALFDLEPAGRRTCRLVMPEGTEIRSVSVAGLPAAIPAEDERPIINLGSDQLPHRIQIVYQGNLRRRDGQLGMEVPLLFDLVGEPGSDEGATERRIEIERSTWTIGTMGHESTRLEFAASGSHQPSSRLSRDLANLRILSDLVADVTSEQPSEVLAHWYRRWARRIGRLRYRIQDQLASVDDQQERSRVEEVIRDVDQQQALFTKRFADVAMVVAEPDVATVSASGLPVDDVASLVPEVALTLTMRGTPTAMALTRVPAVRSGVWKQVAVAILYGAFLIASVFVLKCGFLADVPWRWPHLLGVLFGIGAGVLWFSWLPAAVLVALSVWLALQYPLSRQQVIGR